jgi:hypothetical protein
MESMRVPRIAFALLIACVLALGSSLVIVKVGARSEGNALALNVDLGNDHRNPCYLAQNDKRADGCGAMLPLHGMTLTYYIEILKREGDNIELRVWSKAYPFKGAGFETHGPREGQPQQVWFIPGETTRVSLDGGITMKLTGEWLDHVPPFIALNGNPNLDPGPNELRIASPLLLRDKSVVGDMEGGIATATEPDQGVSIYFPSAGRFIISLDAMPGAVKGQVRMNRIAFELNGQPFTFLTGAPVARTDQVWVLCQPDFKPANR